MNRKLFVACQAAFGAIAALAGWWLGSTPAPAAQPAPALADRPLPAGPRAAVEAPLIAVAEDGRVTLRIEQQPLDWVLDEIARQSGRPAQARAVAREADAAAQACPQPDAPPPAPDAARLRHAIERGSEAERFDGLLQARGDALTIDPATLRTIVETDASERVRLLALEAWLEQQADRPEQQRALLEAALLMPGAELQAEARRRLDELRELERSDPADPQPAALP